MTGGGGAVLFGRAAREELSHGPKSPKSALHPSGVAKSSTSFGWGKGGKSHLCRVAGVISYMACDFP